MLSKPVLTLERARKLLWLRMPLSMKKGLRLLVEYEDAVREANQMSAEYAWITNQHQACAYAYRVGIENLPESWRMAIFRSVTWSG